MIQFFFQVAVATQVLGSGGVGSSPGASPSAVGAYTGSADEIRVRAPAVESADIDIDGRLDDLAWDHAALLDGFTQFNPVEGSAASQRTEIRVLVDSDAIYFSVKAYDGSPGEIRATMAERDTYTRTDDYVRFILDTFDDQRRAYVFTVNPLGVQHDGLWNESGGGTGRRGRGNFGSPIDQSPDFVWDSDGRITEWGYQAEIRIPFKSLRFPEAEEQAWGLQVERKIQRNGFESSWAPITGNVANKLTQAGKLTGLRNLDMGLFMEFNPVLTGSRDGSLDELGNFGHADPTGEFGFNATYGITSNLTLDGTFNPDFSQVEADAGQVSVNERFTLFFPEQRPFFLEGTEIFGMPKQLVHTRTISNPIAGGKLTGKIGSLNIGYLGAIDETFDADAPNTYVNLLRVRKDIGASSTIGAIYTDRTISSSDFNRVAGADARIQFGGRYTVTLMGAQSFSNDADVAERVDGRMGSARIERAGRTFSVNAEFEDTQSDFEPGSGFFRRIGTTQLNSRSSYTWFGKRGGLVEQVSPSLQLRGYWDHDTFWNGGGFQEAEVEVSLRVSFKDNITFFGNLKRNEFEYQPEEYEGLFVAQTDGSYQAFRPDQDLFGGLNGVTFGLWINKWRKLRGNARYTISDTPIFDRGFGVGVEPATSYSGSVTLTILPTRSMLAEIGVTQNRLVRKRDGGEHSSVIIPRIRTQYQFSRSLFVRGIFEYSSQEREALFDPATGLALASCDGGDCSARVGSLANDFRIEGLLAYEPTPGTVFFFGYTRELEDQSAFGFTNVRPTRDGLFVKLSYRFRM